MLKIFKQKNKTIKSKSLKLMKNKENINKYFLYSIKEWNNSVYSYDKNFIKLLPQFNNIINKIMKLYFMADNNLYVTNDKCNKLKTKFVKQSVNKIFNSNVQIKHTNSTITIFLFVYNEQFRYLLDQFEKINTYNLAIKENYINKFVNAKLKYADVCNQIERKAIMFDINTRSSQQFNLLNSIHNSLIDKYLKNEIFIINYLQSVYINKYKFYKLNLSKLSSIIAKLVNKKIVFKIINLKYIYLNTDILMESMALKLKNRNNKLLKTFKTLLSSIKLPVLVKESNKNNINMTCINDRVQDILTNNSINTINKENNVINSIIHKSINGVRLEASGRLSKKLTASRSVFKFKYIGTLKDPKYLNRSMYYDMIRGNNRPNIQYTKLAAKTRNGSFGLKGWISSS